MILFRKTNFSKKYSFWIKFLQVPKTKSPYQLIIDGYSSENIRKYWQKSSRILQLLKILAVMGVVTMSLACLNYLYISKSKYYNLFEPNVFWAIGMVNYCALLFVGIFDFIYTFGLILYLYLISYFLKERFNLIQMRIDRLAYRESKLNLVAINKLIHQFNLIIIDLLKCNIFWSRFNYWNYYFGGKFYYLKNSSFIFRLIF